VGGPNSRIVWSAGHQQAEVVALPVVVKVNAVRADVADIGDPVVSEFILKVQIVLLDQRQPVSQDRRIRSVREVRICEAADQSAWAQRCRSRDKSRRPPDRGLSGRVQGFVQRVA